MVDISYLGFDRENLHRLRHGDQLRDASRLPFDGMNERGLAVAMAQVPEARSPSGERPAGSLGVMRLVLDRAATVAEAVAIFRRTAIDFSGGPPLHYLVADASGDSAVIEYVDGRVEVIPRGERPFQAMTNFVLTGGAPPTTAIAPRWPRCARSARPPDAGDDARPAPPRTAQPQHPLVGRLRPARPHGIRRDGPEVRRPGARASASDRFAAAVATCAAARQPVT